MSVRRIDPFSAHRERHDLLREGYAKAARFARAMRDVLGTPTWVKRIEWDAAGGYPKHSWGYVQFSPRPYKLGYGCDGTVDSNVHLIAERMCKAFGLDYGALYALAYPDAEADAPPSDGGPWKPEDVEDETLIPEAPTLEVWRLIARELGEINNHSLVTVLCDALLDRGIDVGEFWTVSEAPDFWRRRVESVLATKGAQ